MRYSLPAIAMGALALSGAQAQQAAKPVVPPKPAVAVKAEAKPEAHAPAATGDAEVVGSVGNMKVTWGEFIARFQKENSIGFKQSAAQYVGTQGTDYLFGPAPKSSFTITKTEVIAGLRKHPTTSMADELNKMLTFTAVDKEAERMGIHTTVAEEDARLHEVLQNLRAQGKIGPGVSDDKFLAVQNVKRADIRENFKFQVELTALLQKQLEAKQGHPFGPGDFVQARHILVEVAEAKPGVTPEDQKKADDAALAKITKVAEDIHAGKITFEDAVKADSDDAGSKAQGGELGVFCRGVMLPEFENAAFTQKPGEVGKPVRSKYGYHLIQVEKTGADISVAERKKVLDVLENGMMQVYIHDLTTTKYKTENKLAKEAPQNPQMQMQQGPPPQQ